MSRRPSAAGRAFPAENRPWPPGSESRSGLVLRRVGAVGRGAAGARPTAGPEGSKEPGPQKLQESTLEIVLFFWCNSRAIKGFYTGGWRHLV